LVRESSKVAAADWPKANAILPPSLRKILQVSYKDHNITSEEILHGADSRKLAETVTGYRFRMAGHMLHLPVHRPDRVVITWTPARGR